jgi:glycosyltransferase involved in cell wall biosynthesis
VREIDDSVAVDHIPLYWFDDAELDLPARPIAGQNILFVGGFGHPPNRDGLIWFLDTIWPNILEQSPEAKLTIIGSKCPQSVKKLQNTHIQVLGEVSDAVLDDAYREARIAIMPLRYGAGIKGKALEAMSKGVVVCATLVGAEGLPAHDIEYLLATSSESQFAANILHLLQDDSKVDELRTGAIDILKQHFSRDKAKSLINFLGLDE